MRTFINKIVNLITPKIFVYAGLLIFIIIFYKGTLQRGDNFGIMVGLLPFIAILMYLLLKHPLWCFLFLFIANYLIMGIIRYVPLPIPVGIFMDITICSCFLALFIEMIYKKMEWKRAVNPIAFVTSIWLLFCTLELLNPKAVPIADWASNVRGMAVYPIVMVILVSVILRKYKYLKIVLLIWSVLTLWAAFKGYWQKNQGFDSTELMWLYVGGGARTHLISTGIRYFSFFTDAGNYGANMGFSMVVFSIAAFYIKNKWLKLYFLIVAVAGGYGMVISGTRGSLAVPFAGYAICVVLSKNWKVAISATIILISAFFFLNFSTLGGSNQYIRRMRSAFDKNDPSLNVRLENQKRLKEYMADIPFGTSIGFYGYQVERSNSFYEISQIPSDSWYVQVWIQTGIVGLTLHILLLSAVIIMGGYIILFKIRNKELRGLLTAMLAGTFGMLIACYGNELLGQFPNSFLFYICQAFVFMGKYYDKELEEHEQLT